MKEIVAGVMCSGVGYVIVSLLFSNNIENYLQFSASYLVGFLAGTIALLISEKL